MSKKYPVTFDHQPTQPRIEVCTFCGGKVEECPMMRGVCYDCYRRLISANVEDELKEITQTTTEADADALHDLLEALDNGEWLGALAYGDADLGTRFTISGGEVMELDAHLEARYEEQNGGDDLPF